MHFILYFKGQETSSCKALDIKYFRLTRPFNVCHNTQIYVVAGKQSQIIDKQMIGAVFQSNFIYKRQVGQIWSLGNSLPNPALVSWTRRDAELKFFQYNIINYSHCHILFPFYWTIIPERNISSTQNNSREFNFCQFKKPLALSLSCNNNMI